MAFTMRLMIEPLALIVQTFFGQKLSRFFYSFIVHTLFQRIYVMEGLLDDSSFLSISCNLGVSLGRGILVAKLTSEYLEFS